MTFQERIAKLPQPIDGDEVVYSLTKEDVLSVIENELSKEQLALLSDKQLDLLIQGTVKSLDHIDWYGWVQAGIEFHMPNILEEEWE